MFLLKNKSVKFTERSLVQISMQERKPITVCIRDFKSGHARISVLIGLMIDNKHCFFFFKIRERERERERETDRQTDRQTDIQIEKGREGGLISALSQVLWPGQNFVPMSFKYINNIVLMGNNIPFEVSFCQNWIFFQLYNKWAYRVLEGKRPHKLFQGLLLILLIK